MSAQNSPLKKKTVKKTAAFGKSCPKCGSPVNQKDVICINCGHNMKLGVNVKTVRNAKKAGALGFSIAAGAGVALLCGALWAGIVILTGYQIGYIAWGIGLVTGITVAVIHHEKSVNAGAAAALLAAFGILIGKILIVEWAAPDAAKHLSKDQAFMNELCTNTAILQMREKGEIKPEVDQWLAKGSSEEPPAELKKDLQDFNAEVSRRARQIPPAKRRKILNAVCKLYIENISFIDRIKMSSSPFDLLWFALAMGTAFKVVAMRD